MDKSKPTLTSLAMSSPIETLRFSNDLLSWESFVVVNPERYNPSNTLLNKHL